MPMPNSLLLFCLVLCAPIAGCLGASEFYAFSLNGDGTNTCEKFEMEYLEFRHEGPGTEVAPCYSTGPTNCTCTSRDNKYGLTFIGAGPGEGPLPLICWGPNKQGGGMPFLASQGNLLKYHCRFHNPVDQVPCPAPQSPPNVCVLPPIGARYTYSCYAQDPVRSIPWVYVNPGCAPWQVAAGCRSIFGSCVICGDMLTVSYSQGMYGNTAVLVDPCAERPEFPGVCMYEYKLSCGGLDGSSIEPVDQTPIINDTCIVMNNLGSAEAIENTSIPQCAKPTKSIAFPFTNQSLGAVGGGSTYAWVLAVPRFQSSTIDVNSVAKLDLELIPMSGTGLDTQYELRATGNNPIEWHGWKVTSYADAMLLHDGRYGYNTWILDEQGHLRHSASPDYYMYADGTTKCYNNLNACVSNTKSSDTWAEISCPPGVSGSCIPQGSNAATFGVNTDPDVQVPGSATVYEIGNEIPVVGGIPYTSTSTSPINTNNSSMNKAMIIALSVAVPVALVLLVTISICIYRRHAVKKASTVPNIVSSTVTVTETAAQVEMSQVQ